MATSTKSSASNEGYVMKDYFLIRVKAINASKPELMGSRLESSLSFET
jgi:hypothetical protein